MTKTREEREAEYKSSAEEFGWEYREGIVGVQASISFWDDFVVSHRVDCHTVSYRPAGQHKHVGMYATAAEAFQAAADYYTALAAAIRAASRK